VMPLAKLRATARRPVTMADVGARAGVSKATVSRTINRPDIVCAPVRYRVWRAIAELDYVLNIDAQRLRIGIPRSDRGAR
jgi:LacI family transcriptional regulator